MRTFIYKLLYTTLALSLTVFVYVVNKGHSLEKMLDKWEFKDTASWFSEHVPSWVSYMFYLLILMTAAFLMSKASRLLVKREVESKSIESIEPAGDGMMVTYFGLFFFALSVENSMSLAFTFIILLTCILISNVYMFNPLFSIIGYRFYYLKMKSGKKCLLITREKFARDDIAVTGKLYKLNDFTFID